MKTLARFALPVLLAGFVAGAALPAQATEPAPAAPAGQQVGKFLIHVEGMT